MKITKSLFLLISGIYFISCNSSNEPVKKEAEDVDTTEQAEVNTEGDPIRVSFPKLSDYLTEKDTAFRSRNIQEHFIMSTEKIAPTPIDQQQLNAYAPYLIFNTDSSLAIDFVTHSYVISHKDGKQVIESGGPDTEIALMDFKKNLRKRILFTGSSQIILDARWENPNTILIAAAEDLGDNRIKPSFIRYYLDQDNYEVFQYKDTLQADVSNYTEQMLNAKANLKNL
jgi:hypothetical protein